jgi:hypothetical protein
MSQALAMASCPDREAFHDCDARYAQALQRIDIAVEPCFVGNAVIPVGELAELRNIGAGDKSFAPSAPEHSDADTAIFVNRGAGCAESVVHRPGHRVARPWPIEQNVRDGIGNMQCYLSVAG